MNYGSAIEDPISRGELLGGVDYGAVYQLRYRMKERFTQDNVLQLQYRNVEQTIKESVEC